jgi:hypothetical protein
MVSGEPLPVRSSRWTLSPGSNRPLSSRSHEDFAAALAEWMEGERTLSH